MRAGREAVRAARVERERGGPRGEGVCGLGCWATGKRTRPVLETGLWWVAGWEEKEGWAASGFPGLGSDHGSWWAAGPGEERVGRREKR